MHHDLPRKPTGKARKRFRALFLLAGLWVGLILLGGYLRWANQLPLLQPELPALPDPNGYDACAQAVAGPLSDPAVRNLTPTAAEAATWRSDLAQSKLTLDALRKAMRLGYQDPQPLLDRPYGDRSSAYRAAGHCFLAEAVLSSQHEQYGAASEQALNAIELGDRISHGRLTDWLVGRALMDLTRPALGAATEKLTADEAVLAGKRMDRILADVVPPDRLMEEAHR